MNSERFFGVSNDPLFPFLDAARAPALPARLQEFEVEHASGGCKRQAEKVAMSVNDVKRIEYRCERNGEVLTRVRVESNGDVTASLRQLHNGQTLRSEERFSLPPEQWDHLRQVVATYPFEEAPPATESKPRRSTLA